MKDAAGVRNLERIVRAADDELMVVVSAMGKTTNALERVVEFLDAGKEEQALNQWVDITSRPMPGQELRYRSTVFSADRKVSNPHMMRCSPLHMSLRWLYRPKKKALMLL